MNSKESRRTRAHVPDLDWSQIRETVLMLEVAAGQVDAAMRDSNASVGVLTETFTAMADSIDRVNVALDTLPDSVGNGMVKDEIRQGTHLVADKVHQAIIAFQFYDKLVQRLDHVCHGLAGLSQLVADNARIYNPQAWADLQRQIREKYTMEEERAMFDAVLDGMSVQEALEHYMTARMQQVEASGGEIELF